MPSAAPGAVATAPARLHLHVLELADGEVKVLDGGVVLGREVVEQEIGKVGAGKG